MLRCLHASDVLLPRQKCQNMTEVQGALPWGKQVACSNTIGGIFFKQWIPETLQMQWSCRAICGHGLHAHIPLEIEHGQINRTNQDQNKSHSPDRQPRTLHSQATSSTVSLHSQSLWQLDPPGSRCWFWLVARQVHPKLR